MKYETEAEAQEAADKIRKLLPSKDSWEIVTWYNSVGGWQWKLSADQLEFRVFSDDGCDTKFTAVLRSVEPWTSGDEIGSTPIEAVQKTVAALKEHLGAQKKRLNALEQFLSDIGL